MEREIRGGIPVEVRADDDGTVTVEGYAAVFDELADIGGMFTEQFAQGAFRDAVRADDVVFLVNHEGLPLGRTRAGTLTLKEDKRGLKMRSELDGDDPDVRALVPKMRRGDLDKMSIAFRATKQEWDDAAEPPHRTITRAQLFDVSVVTTPAYDGTDIALRSLEKSQADERTQNFHAARRRLRMKMHLRLRDAQPPEKGTEPISNPKGD